MVEIKHSPYKIDAEIFRLIGNLNFLFERPENWTTVGSCSGHGKYPMTIVLQSKGGVTYELFSGIFLPRKKRFYIKDKEGFFYIPETIGEKDLIKKINPFKKIK